MSKKKKQKQKNKKQNNAKKQNAPKKVTPTDNDGISEETRRLSSLIPHRKDFTEKDFSKSVENMKSEDIKVSDSTEKTKKKKTKKKRSKAENIIELTLLGICASAVIVCLVMLAWNIWGKVRGAEIYGDAEFNIFTLDDDAKDRYNHPASLSTLSSDSSMLSLFDRIAAGRTPESEKDNSKYAEKLAEAKASLTALKARNEDVIGWIYIEGTNINHPLLQGNDNTYYLTHAYTKENLPIGSIFMDFTCSDIITENYNSVIYGHNVTTNAMFHEVTNFMNEKDFKNNLIYIYTMDGVYIFKAASIYTTTADVPYYRTAFRTEEDFLEFAKSVVAKSTVASTETFEKGDHMLTLSTCTNSGNGRYALHAKLIDIIN